MDVYPFFHHVKVRIFCPMQSQGKLFPESDLTSLQSGLHVPKMNCLLNDIITSVQLLKAGIMRPMEFQN